jgi:hypothetical protein
MEFLMDLQRVVACLGKRTTVVLLATLCITGRPGMTVAADTEAVEYAVKATYLSKFSYYVQWPRTAFSSSDSAVNLCVVGHDPFGVTLDKAVSGENIGGRAIAIRRLKTVGCDSGCHILYIGASETQRPSEIFETVRGSSVLTVSDTSRTETAAGIINFVTKDNRVRFDIDDEAAAQNGLSFSSKLLGLAFYVKARSTQGPR